MTTNSKRGWWLKKKAAPRPKRYYLEGDLFHPSKGIAGHAQVPHCFNEGHNGLLNKIVEQGERHVDENGRVYYTISDTKTLHEEQERNEAFIPFRMG